MSILRWKVSDLVDVLYGCTQNKFDAIVFISGARGLGKSTLGYILACKCRARGLSFNPETHMVYSRKETLRLLATKKKTVILSDEMVNVSYSRDFYEQEQKTLLKALNLYRDSCNVFLGCIPSFSDLDIQMKRLCKIKIYVKRRGVAIIEVPVRGMYNPDPWDTKANIKKEEKNPNAFSRFSTVKGILRFGDLKPKARAKYERLKAANRNRVFNANLDLKDLNPQQQMIEKIYNKIESGNFTKQYLIDSAELLNKKYTALCSKLNLMLKDKGKPTISYFIKQIEKKEKEEDIKKKIAMEGSLMPTALLNK